MRLWPRRVTLTCSAVTLAAVALSAAGFAQEPPGCDPPCTFEVSGRARSIVVSPSGEILYVGIYSPSGGVDVIRRADHVTITNIPVSGQCNPLDLAITPDGQYLYATNVPNCYSTSKIATATNTVVSTIPGGTDPAEIAVSPDGSIVVIGTHWSPFVQIVDVATDAELARVSGMGNGTLGIAITPDGNYAYVALRHVGPNPGPPYVIKLDLSTYSKIDTVFIGGSEQLDITPDGNELWVPGHTFSDYVYVVSTSSDEVVDSIFIGGDPYGIRISPDGQFAYVSQILDSGIVVLSVADREVVGTLPAAEPGPIAVTPDGVSFFTGSGDSCLVEYTRTSVCSAFSAAYAPCSFVGSDIDCNGQTDAIDLAYLIDILFAGEPEPADCCPFEAVK